MDKHTSSLILLMIAKEYADKTNKLKSLEICKIAENTLKNYTKEEFMTSMDFKLQGMTLEEKILFSYVFIKEKLSKNNDPRLIEINDLLKSLNKDEEDELMDVIIITMTKPSEIILNKI